MQSTDVAAAEQIFQRRHARSDAYLAAGFAEWEQDLQRAEHGRSSNSRSKGSSRGSNLCNPQTCSRLLMVLLLLSPLADQCGG